MDNNDKYIGQILDNRYEIIEKIGTGGMAVVYKARCHRLNRFVAVKILKDEFGEDDEFRRRFHSESQAVAMLSHPNIVAVYDVSRSGNVEYIVMELIEGITLKQYINRKGLLNWKESLHFATQITKAIGHAHSRGIIHRDIKPHNIMILKDGSVKVADFGIARLQSTQNTLTQAALGSVHYISPEQAKGSFVDARSDIYSVGVVMYEMLTSRLPFEGDSAVSIAIQHISAFPLMPREINPDIPAGLEAITMHAMEPDLANRYASADELLQDLEDFRKNPAMIFNYTASEHSADANPPEEQATRAIPAGAIVKAGSHLPKPKRSAGKAVPSKEEYSKNQRKSGKTSTLVAVFTIIVFLIIVGIMMWPTISGWFFPKDISVTIPNFVGTYYDDVSTDEEYTEQYTFTVDSSEFDDTYAEGMIISQDPKADRKQTIQNAGVKIEIKVVLSLGSEPVRAMPDLVNHDWREAKIQLEELQMSLEIVTEPVPDESVTPGYVISTIPGKGETLTEGGTVFITYSDGPLVVNVKMPDLVGKSYSAATTILESYDLSYSDPPQYEYSDEVSKDKVIDQSYEAGDEIPIHTKVVLIVSQGPEPTPSPSPSPSEEPSPSPSEEPPATTSPSP